MQIDNTQPIAILLAVYNGEKYLAEQLDSILAQDASGWTLYIRDDASTDRTKSIIRSYTERYPSVVEIEDGLGNLGCRGNFFKLLETVESDYYMFSDADDVWLPEKIALSYQRMRSMEDHYPGRPVIVHTDCTVVDENLNVIYPTYWGATRFVPERFYAYNLLAIQNPVAGALMMMNRRVKNLMFPLADNTLLHDRWISMVTARNGGVFSAIHIPALLYRQHAGNVYGIDTIKKRNCRQRLADLFRLNLYVARKLKQAGYGSYLKYVYYKGLVLLKSKFQD